MKILIFVVLAMISISYDKKILTKVIADNWKHDNI